MPREDARACSGAGLSWLQPAPSCLPQWEGAQAARAAARGAPALRHGELLPRGFREVSQRSLCLIIVI